VFLATSNVKQRLLFLSYIGRVNADELHGNEANLRALLGGLPAGFRLLVDLSQLEFMDLDCIPELGGIMEIIDQAGVGMVARVIPDPNKDIGLNILTVFHYPRRPQVTVCETTADAIRWLSLKDE